VVGTDEERRALQTWLGVHLSAAGEVHIGEVRRPQGSGFSAETLIFDVAYVVGGEQREHRLVLRKETPDPAVYPTQVPGLDVEIDIQYRVMSALRAKGEVPIAPLLGYESDPGVLGAPFFVMGYVSGQVPIESPPYTLEGFFVAAQPADRRAMIEDGVRTLARLHTLDWQAAGLQWLIAPGVPPGTATQLDIWERYARNALGGREHPTFERGVAWLRSHRPDDDRVGFCWGDARPGNIIWSGFRAACLTDFEAACISCPEQDLGWWLMFDRSIHEAVGAERLDGDPTRDEQREMYERASGRPVGDTAFHEIFAAMRYTGIVVQVMNRAVARGDLPAEQTIWLDNPATFCLVQLLDEHT